MATIAVKAFFCQKEGSIRSCKDRMKMDISRGRFVVADGVSNSYHPEITAELLCEDFITSDCEYDAWPTFFAEKRHAELYQKWVERTDAYLATLSGRKLKHERYRKEDLPVGASTFAGIVLDLRSHELSYDILGDSTLFLVDDRQQVQAFGTNQKEEREGRQYLVYDNHPSCILADQQKVGDWIFGKQALTPGYVILATDGAAQWIQEAYMDSPAAFDELWQLQNHRQFVEWVDHCRQSGAMEDDITLLMLKIEEGETDAFEEICIDDWESLCQEEENLEKSCGVSAEVVAQPSLAEVPAEKSTDSANLSQASEDLSSRNDNPTQEEISETLQEKEEDHLSTSDEATAEALTEANVDTEVSPVLGSEEEQLPPDTENQLTEGNSEIPPSATSISSKYSSFFERIRRTLLSIFPDKSKLIQFFRELRNKLLLKKELK